MLKIHLPFPVHLPTFAAGADMKGAFALARGRDAFLFTGFGDLNDADNLARYSGSVAQEMKRLKISPKIIACDLHPNYFSTRFSENYPTSTRHPLFRVQHHKAHIASAIIDNDIHGRAIGIAFDGTGYGDDGAIWGGEFMVVDHGRQGRVGHLKYVQMVGGENAIREPWRMLASYLHDLSPKKALSITKRHIPQIDSIRIRPLLNLISQKDHGIPTSSCGRLFDAAAALILSRGIARFEAELPSELEKKVITIPSSGYKASISLNDDIFIVDFRAVFKEMLLDIGKGRPVEIIAGKFHFAVALSIAETCEKIRKRYGDLSDVLLSGGVFQNRILSKLTKDLLAKRSFNLRQPKTLPVNDESIPIGQIAIANAAFRP